MTGRHSDTPQDTEDVSSASRPVDPTAGPGLEQSMRQLLAAQQIQRAMAHYSQFVSDRRYAEWAGLFTKDGQLTGPDGVHARGREDLERFIRASHAGWRMKHVTANIIIDSDPGAGRATATSDWVVMRVDGGTNRISAVGRYEDSFVDVGGQWQFARRHAVALRDDAV